MWKFMPYPQWKYDAIEEKLSQLEGEGCRLVEARFLWFFRFERSAPRETKYIFTYSLPKEYGMLDCEQTLKREHQANEIKTRHFGAMIYRVTDLSRDLSDIVQFRNKYLIRVFATKLLLVLFLAIMCGIYSLCGGYGIIIIDLPMFGALILYVLLVLYYLCGLVRMLKHRKAATKMRET